MPNTDTNMTSQQPEPAKPFLQTNKPLAIGAAILMVASGLLGYTVGHRQGLTVLRRSLEKVFKTLSPGF